MTENRIEDTASGNGRNPVVPAGGLWLGYRRMQLGFRISIITTMLLLRQQLRRGLDRSALRALN